MPNYFLDNKDILFHFNNLDLKEIVRMAEDNYEESKKYNYAPVNYEDAMESYRKVLEMVGDIAGNFISERATDVDLEEAQFRDGKVHYAKGTQENLKQLSLADLSGMIIPRKYGGLNIPFTIYMVAVEMISRADASLMNIFGLQDIGDTIKKFGNEEQREKYLPGFCTGEYTGAMALTEPDAGSDLQAVKLQAYQNEKGQWFLRGVKRFITNGNGEVLLVLARSEPGTKDGRGLSMFVCRNDKTVKVRRIEHKLGIHGSPTCELQFSDTPAELVGSRKFGLIKYVLDLMFRARMGVSAQALGISQAAYEEAYKYAREREQFGKPIFNIPVVTNMLLDMRVMLESNRSLFYATAKSVDIKEKLEEEIERLKNAGQPVNELNARLKQATKIANFLTPLTKYITSECANKMTYDSLQIHGGTGYMREFKVERLARDARITNIYEGTSQLQIVASSGGVINDILSDYFDEKENREYKGGLVRLLNFVKEIRTIFKDCLKYVIEKKDPTFQDIASKDLVELYGYIYVGFLLLEEAGIEPRKVFIANRYIITSLANARKNAESIKSELFSDIMHQEEILN
ncbi:MAG: acyl-CoA dehydrogenase family protein [Ignavibacteriaceae bacterium]|jgi:alkylation response protein AidB-like acyl-CoA dehydrogenase|nr:acyl-CoA dehydrogenase family protein [Ignavibacteriaceae bacterium]